MHDSYLARTYKLGTEHNLQNFESWYRYLYTKNYRAVNT